MGPAAAVSVCDSAPARRYNPADQPLRSSAAAMLQSIDALSACAHSARPARPVRRRAGVPTGRQALRLPQLQKTSRLVSRQTWRWTMTRRACQRTSSAQTRATATAMGTMLVARTKALMQVMQQTPAARPWRARGRPQRPSGGSPRSSRRTAVRGRRARSRSAPPA